MTILFVSKNCQACKRLKDSVKIPESVKTVYLEEATDEQIGSLVDKNVRAIPILVKDDGKTCTGVDEICECLKRL